MKYLLFALTLCATIASADIFRLPLTSSAANTNGIIVSASNTIVPYSRGMLSAMTIYDCATNTIATAATNTIYRIGANGAITNTLGTVVIGNTATTADMTISTEIPFASGDSILVVGNTQDRIFKASCIFITR